MQLDFAIVSERAEVSLGGQIHFWGAGFESIASDSFPAWYQFFVTVKMRLDEDDLGHAHHIRLEVTNPAGETKEIFSDPNSMVGPARLPDRPAYATFVVGFNFQFLNPGEYSFRFFADGIEVKAWPIFLHKRDAVQSGAQPT